MTKLIGTNPNQVPSNADLGSAAFMEKKDFLTSRGSSLSEINSIMPATAKAVFIYDTSKDSDGGAWRKRTQNTTWYREPINTQVRGGRREFPAVAVIVAENDRLRIYDGDDPTLPMWMEFIATGSNGTAMIGRVSEDNSCVYMLNGTLCLGRHSFGLHIINFIGDYAQFKENGWDTTYAYPIGTHRNLNNYWELPYDQGNDLVNDKVNSVTMRVMDGAPIDSRSGLPRPTIAVACGGTPGGVTVIRDDGIAVDISSGSYGAKHIEFVNDRIINVGVRDIGTGGATLYSVNMRVPVADYAFGSTNCYNEMITSGSAGGFIYGNTHRPPAVGNGTSDSAIMEEFDEHRFNQQVTGSIAASTGRGALHIFERDNDITGSAGDAPSNMHRISQVVIGEDYNTGWLHGDQRLCTLADTEAGTIYSTGENLLANKTFVNNGSFPYESFSATGLNLSVQNTTGYGAANLTWNMEIGLVYSVKFNLTLNSGVAPQVFVNGTSSWGNGRSFVTRNGVNYFTFTGTTSGSQYFNFSTSNGDATNFSVANLEMWKGGVADRGDDRNQIRNGMSVVGQLTRRPVATGAELVSYEGFSSSNYLQQNYNGNLNFGTGDFYISGWFDTCADGRVLVERVGIDQDGTTNGATDISKRLYIYTANGKIYVTFGNTGWNTGIDTGGSGWKNIAFARKSGVIYSYLNGKLVHTQHGVTDVIGDTDHFLRIGTGFPYRVSPCTGKLALWKFSASSPTHKQIARWYEDEKKMFLPYAKCTLYGTTPQVPAVAYDRETKLIHAGTSSGRSVFSGITRIDNTTKAVDTEISAANGMVIEIDQ